MKSSSIKNKPKKGAARALVLFSGGLDSILTVKILERQKIDVTALTFVSYFFTSEEAGKSARENKIRLRVEDIAPEHFCIIRKPKFGYGVGMNPCIDCHLLMLKAAKYIMKKDKYDFLATGEVLGQRPMSQNAGALKLIEKEARLIGKILRPLSAKVLPETEMEKTGLADRKKLLGISGRSRKEQIKLAEELGIKSYPSPAGGCILTDKEYSKKLRELLQKIEKPKPSDLELLRIGRHFWIRPVRKSESLETKNVLSKDKISKKLVKPKLSNGVGSTLIILGRNHEENLKLKKIAEKSDMLVEPKNVPGPTALVRGGSGEEVLELAKEKIIEYTKKIKAEKVKFICQKI